MLGKSLPPGFFPNAQLDTESEFDDLRPSQAFFNDDSIGDDLDQETGGNAEDDELEMIEDEIGDGDEAEAEAEVLEEEEQSEKSAGW